MFSSSARAVLVGLFVTLLARGAHAEEDPLGADARATIDALAQREAERRAADDRAAAAEAARAAEVSRRAKEFSLAADRADASLRKATANEKSRVKRRNIGTWTIIGGSGLTLLGGALYASALSAEGAVKDGGIGTGAELESTRDRIGSFSAAGVVFGVLGAAALATGAVFVLTSSAPDTGGLGKKRVGNLQVDLGRGEIAW